MRGRLHRVRHVFQQRDFASYTSETGLEIKYSSVKTDVALQVSSSRYRELRRRPGFWDFILVSTEMSVLLLRTR